MNFDDVVIAVQKVSDLERRMNNLENCMTTTGKLSELPEFISLKKLCEICGLSYSTMRKAEYRDQLPRLGERDVVIAGRGYWVRSTVERFLRDCESGADRE